MSEKILALKSAEEKIITFENQLSNLKENETNSTGQKPTHLIELNSTVSIEILWVEPGTFTIGSPTTEAGREFELGRAQCHAYKWFWVNTR